AAHPGAAMGDDLTAGIEFVDALRQIAQRNQMAANVADLIFVWLAHIQDEDIFACVQFLLELFHLHLWHIGCHWRFLPAYSAKLVVVYEARDRRVRAADRAVRIFTQL